MNRNQDNQGLIDAGAGWLKWDYQQNKYVWINKSSPLKRKQVVTRGVENEGEKRVKHMGFKLQGKKAIRQPLAVHNEQERKKKSPVKANKAAKVQKPMGGRIIANARAVNPSSHQQAGNLGDDSVILDQIQRGHGAMLTVLQARHLKVNAANTLWRTEGAVGLISYLVKCNDDSVVADFLPLITKCIKDEKVPVSLGSCQELLPVLSKLLNSKYEDYINKTLDLLRAILKQWWKDLSTYNENAQGRMLRSRNIPSVYNGIVQMSDVINKLAKRECSIGERARLLTVFLRQM